MEGGMGEAKGAWALKGESREVERSSLLSEPARRATQPPAPAPRPIVLRESWGS